MSLGRVMMGVGVAFAAVGAATVAVALDEFDRTDPKPSLLPRASVTRPFLEIGAATLAMTGLGLYLGGLRPGTLGRGMIWGAAIVPVTALSVLIVGAEHHPLTRIRT